MQKGRRFPLGRSTVHLCVDMQRLFAEKTPWHMPWMPRVLPQIHALARRYPTRTMFTRFIPPRDPAQALGAWRDYYAQWREITREHLDLALLELVEPLAALVPPAKLIDKMAYSAFQGTGLATALRRQRITTLIVSGGETDVCVLATVMAAVDEGFRVVLPTDALCSVRDETHEALLTLYRERFTMQIEATTIADVLERWDCEASQD